MSNLLLLMCIVVVSGNASEPEEKKEPTAPVIIEQPLRKILATVGEDLVLPLKVQGEQPLRYYREGEGEVF